MSKPKIIFVDDEEYNLEAFQAYFRREYEIYTFTSADEALLFLNFNKIEIIISDEKMAGTTGIEFLERVSKIFPDSIRVLITAYADLQLLESAINRGQIYKFLHKPWDWEKLKLVIENCEAAFNYKNELKIQNEALTKANFELNKFVYSVSHDLRSPLTSILGLIEITKSTPDLKVASNYFELIEEKVIKLDGYIKRLLDYFRNDRSELKHSKINFTSIIEETWLLLSEGSKKINFNTEVIEDDQFFGDPVRLEIIFENLISNAIKYQNPSIKNQEIFVKIRVDHNKCTIAVTDNGIGIDQSYADKVFELFFRANANKNDAGSGLGLYIVKDTVERMNGEIKLFSEPMKGSTFYIELPNRKLMKITA
ncbi:MAG: ATP-binding protein [Bacteroidia bacterium]